MKQTRLHSQFPLLFNFIHPGYPEKPLRDYIPTVTPHDIINIYKQRESWVKSQIENRISGYFLTLYQMFAVMFWGEKNLCVLFFWIKIRHKRNMCAHLIPCTSYHCYTLCQEKLILSFIFFLISRLCSHSSSTDKNVPFKWIVKLWIPKYLFCLPVALQVWRKFEIYSFWILTFSFFKNIF